MVDEQTAAVGETSGVERLLTGMLGMGAIFAAGGFLLIAMLGSTAIVVEGADRGGFRAFGFVLFAGTFVAFLLGVIYAGLLALLARGRSFRDVKLLHVGVAGGIVGFIPPVLLAAIMRASDEVLELRAPLLLFPLAGAVLGVATLLMARRAKAEPVADVSHSAR